MKPNFDQMARCMETFARQNAHDGQEGLTEDHLKIAKHHLGHAAVIRAKLEELTFDEPTGDKE